MSQLKQEHTEYRQARGPAETITGLSSRVDTDEIKAKFFPVRDVPVSEMTDQEIEELRDTL